jgi:hypothetical protein
MHLLFFLCLNECDLQEVSSILDLGFLGSVEVSWSGENAGNTHSKKSIALLLRVRICFFCCDWCDVHVRSILAWVLWPGAETAAGYNSAISAKHALFFVWPNMSLSL